MDPIISAGLLSLGAGGLVYAFLSGAQQHRERLDKRLRALARRHGGRVWQGRPTEMQGLDLVCDVGPLKVRFVSTDGDDSGSRTDFSVETPRPLPALVLSPQGERSRWLEVAAGQDVQVGDRGFDDAFLVRAEDPTVARVSLAPEARQILLRLLGRAAAGELQLHVGGRRTGGGSSVRLRVEGWIFETPALEAFILDTGGLAAALVDAWDGPWLALARRLELGELEVGDSGQRCLAGELDGLTVRIREIVERGEVSTEIRVRGPAPRQLRVVHRDVARLEGWESARDLLGNPVLDMLVSARCSDLERVRTLFSDDELTACLLEVVHAHPGSELTERGVRLRIDEQPAVGPGAALELALSLARALRAGMARLEGPS